MKQVVVITPVKNLKNVRHTFQENESCKGIQVKFEGLTKGIQGVATYFDKTLIAPEILRLAYQAQQDGADAVIINCLSEPGLAAAKELLSIPVIGIFEACLQTIAVSKEYFSIILPKFHLNYLQILKETITLANLQNSFTSFHQIDIEENKEKQKTAIAMVIKEAALQECEQAIILSSTYLAQFEDFGLQIISTLEKNLSLMIPLLESLRYVKQIFAGTQNYRKNNLLPPKTEKVEQWLKDLSLSFRR